MVFDKRRSVMKNTRGCDDLNYSAGGAAAFRRWSEPDILAPRRLYRFPDSVPSKIAQQAVVMKRTNSSMQLTRAADYAVRVMIYLASRRTGERVLLPVLAAATAAPESFLSKVLQALSRAKLIVSRRGHAGGFEMLAKGREASMRHVIEAIDGPLYLNVCLIAAGACPRDSWCPAHPVWVEAQQAMLDVLSGAFIAELASPAAGRAGRMVPATAHPPICDCAKARKS
jgi:Rrf2 family protein